ncbi:hypothetical protein PsorP6_005503 [Peronosclerospora sorghi]|uniref:Uncharacterized protein n=1 Tax=Peronosclerospora sorghi TaxID=230839 RepID=A0ACC0W7A4_9STRA|nr:hypothetical protein PsorP6_005503 [Peronosclerospora sorghi]
MATWFQKEIVLTAPSRGFHLVTREVEKQVSTLPPIWTSRIDVSFDGATVARVGSSENWDGESVYKTYLCVAQCQ